MSRSVARQGCRYATKLIYKKITLTIESFGLISICIISLNPYRCDLLLAKYAVA